MSMSSRRKIETRSMTKKKDDTKKYDAEIGKEETSEKKTIKSISKASSIRSSIATITLAKKKAELAATKKITQLEIAELKMKKQELDLERSVIEKELEVEIAELSLQEEDCSSVTTHASKSKVQEWLTEQNKMQQFHSWRKDLSYEVKNRNNNCNVENCLTNIKENKMSDIQLLAREISSLRRPISDNKELQPFFGNVHEWLSFKASYEDTKEYLSESENIIRLRRCLRGDAREAVACLLHTHTSPKEIIDALELRFGRPELIIQEQITTLKELPKLNDSSEQLCKFACKVKNCVASIKALNKPEYLNSVELNQILKLKIPHLKSRWLSYALEHENDNDPELLKLSDFLQREAVAASKFWLLESGRPSTSQRYSTQKILYTDNFDEGNFRDEADNCYISKIYEERNINCPYCESQEHKTVQECNKFKEITVDERWKWAQTTRHCFKCLRSRHRRENCRARPCGIDGCRMSHSRLLHVNKDKIGETLITVAEPINSKTMNEDSTEKIEQVIDSMTTCTNCISKNRILLKIIPVTIKGSLCSKNTYALLDEGSTLTLLKENLAKMIGLEGTTESFTLAGVNATTEELHSIKGDLEIVGPSNEVVKLEGVRTIKSLPLAPQTVHDLTKYKHLQNLPVTTMCYDHATPELLIGQDNWHALIAKDIRYGKKNEPVASLGWVVHGFANSYTNVVNFVGQTNLRIDEKTHKIVEEYFKIDSMGISQQKKQNKADLRAIEILDKTAKRVEDGKRWEVGLLWREDFPNMPDSYNNASKRLRLVEKKMDLNKNYGQKYKDNMDNFLKSGYARPCEPIESPRKWYLPHFGVTHINKPDKLRIVFDAACKVKGISLNDKLLTGPDLLSPLLGIIFKFREGKFAVSSDIKEMFLQIRIRPEDRPAQRFLWRDFDRDGKMKEHEMKSVMFGAACSPTTAIYILRRNADEFVSDFPDAVHFIKTRFYMDDYLHSFDSEEDAIKTIKEVANINLNGGFKLTRWMSNNTRIITYIDEMERGSGGINFDSNTFVKILGLRWDPVDDTLGFNLTFTKIPPSILKGSDVPTKREALRILMSLFDPLGLLTPNITQGKILLQRIWRSGVDWDQKIKEPEAALWNRWLICLKSCCTFKVSRCYFVDALQSRIELHTFCDASEKAFACAAYWRFITNDGRILVCLVASKSRVAPSRPITIPRLELMAAVLGVRLADTIIKDHESFKFSKRYFWTDSSIVYAWIAGDARDYKTFVSNRLGEIAELSEKSEWKWLPTDLNVADDATREVENLSTNHRWFTGPQFLYKTESFWPTQNLNSNININLPDQKKKVLLVFTNITLIQSLPDIKRFSKWLKLIRSTAFVLLFIECIREKKHISLRRSHFDTAEILWLRQSQKESFNSELDKIKLCLELQKSNRLFKLNTYLDKDGLIRLRGRANAIVDIDSSIKEPIVLDGRNNYTRLLVQHYHEKGLHGSCETIVNELRQRFWIIHLRPTVKTIEHLCQRCRIRKSKPSKIFVGDLPAARLAHHQRPFSHCGLDYFGPMLVRIGRRHEKRYGALFMCLTTRAVHIELASSLSTDSAVLALRRMMARRGCPKVIYSDNGTNFHGAKNELQKAMKELDSEKFRNISLNYGVQMEWKFNPPTAAHMGGSWERLVRCFKKALASTISEVAPPEEILLTLLIEAEHIINSRPLIHVSVNPDDVEALTPNHFILGTSSGVPLPGNFHDVDLMGRKQWRKSQRLADIFWQRWVKEYLPTILPRSSLGQKTVNLKEGDFVIIGDSNMPRNVWPKGIVQRVFPGPDGKVRVAEVRTTSGILRRPAVKLIRIPIEDNTTSS